MYRLPLLAILDRVEATLEERRVELDGLDAALGDGDHGTNLARAIETLRREHGELAAMPLGDALREIARVMREEMGGDGGRMYAALLAGMAEPAPADGDLDLATAIAMFDAGLAALRREGGLGVGAKTMLDVLVPVGEALHRHRNEPDPEALGAYLVAAAGHALHHTRDLRAGWGRAAALGDATVGHIDPGACSAALVVGAVIDALAERYRQ
ncbi:MAG TPA: DAK2 domain-containing protein [Rhodospirillales bacterium]|nr:DAK2 domain-containing protein [Rhodospirillales bacterium]